MAATGFTVYGQCVSVPMPWFVMYTAIDVYHAPQMKNWRNIITDSLVRITASGCRYGELLGEPDDNVVPRGQHDIGILRLRRDARARGGTDDAADDSALAVPTEHAAEYRARGGTRTYLRRITGCHATAFVHRLDRVNRRIDRVRIAVYSDARNGNRQGARSMGIGRRFHLRDPAADRCARVNHDVPLRVCDVLDDVRRERVTGLRGPRGERVVRGDVNLGAHAQVQHRRPRGRRRWRRVRRWALVRRRLRRRGRIGMLRHVAHLRRRFRGTQRQIARSRITGLAGLLAFLARIHTKQSNGRQCDNSGHGFLSVDDSCAVGTRLPAPRFYNRRLSPSGVRPCRYPASSVKLSVTSRMPSTISIPPAIRSTHTMYGRKR